MNIAIGLCLMFGLAACDRHISGDLDLLGECMIDSLVLDGEYAGVTDAAGRTVTVGVSDGYAVDDMEVSYIAVSEGATADIARGGHVNMLSPRSIRVANGDVYIDWTLRVQYAKAEILSFVVNGQYVGSINQGGKTIKVYVPASQDVTALTPVIKVSDGAVVTPGSGVAQNFTAPVVYTVVNGSVENTYMVSVEKMDAPQALFVGTASSIDGLAPEERAACDWMLGTVERSRYCSWTDFRNGKTDLSECKVIWWHFHKDGGVDGKSAFENAAPEAVAALAAMQAYVDGGGSVLLSRYATYLPGYLRLNGQEPTGCFPNNCWGGNEDAPETTKEAWSFFAANPGHALFSNLMTGSDPMTIYTCEAGYKLTNSTAQWHIGSDWGGYETREVFEQKTGAQTLAVGGDGAVVVWEYPRTETNGAILCIGTGCYDWYSVDGVYGGYHDNVNRMTLNAINYLKQ